MADRAGSPTTTARQGTRQARRSDPPGFTFEIRYVSGAEGERLEAVQLDAIREVLQWLHEHHRHHTRPPTPPAPP